MATTETLTFQEPGRISTGPEDSVLAGIWRQILTDLKVDSTLLSEKINKYAERVTQSKPSKLAQVRGNLRTDVSKTTMTWFTLMKCLRVLDVDFVTMEFKCQHVHRNSAHLLGVKLEDIKVDELDEDKSDSTEPNTLSLFFKDILFNLDVGVLLFEELLNRFMARTKIDRNLRSKTNIRGYIKKDFYAPRMSWKNFIKGMNFLCVLRMDLSITLSFRRGRVSTHQYSVQLASREDYADEILTGRGI